MSSHHIIREKQEPALLILDLSEFEDENLGQLLEWSPTIIVSEEAYEHVFSLGIKIDVVLTPIDDLAQRQEHLKVLHIGQEKVLDFAFRYLIQEEYPSVNIITQDFYPEKYKTYVEKIDLVVFQNHQKIFPIKSGFSKWKPSNENIEIISKETEITLAKGLTKVENHLFITENDGFYTLQFKQAFAFIAEDI